jgi:hypothetical protein
MAGPFFLERFPKGVSRLSGKKRGQQEDGAPRRSKQTFLGYPTNACFDSFVFAEFSRKTGKATFANSA